MQRAQGPRPFIARSDAVNRKARSHNGYDGWCIGPVGGASRVNSPLPA